MKEVAITEIYRIKNKAMQIQEMAMSDNIVGNNYGQYFIMFKW